MNLTPGSRVGPYEILAPLGEGGMGIVYRARDARLGRDVAIKVLPAAATLDPDRLARFDREARLLAALSHPHIATIYAIEQSGGVPALVMELVEGDTLAEIIARGPVPAREALRLAGQIADALDAAHGKGVIHRDLKPANIKVTPQRQIKVLDFGLAKALATSELEDQSQLPTVTDAGTREGLVIGTAAYMSPEQARGQPMDKRTDIWAFGCVVYEMLTGKRAFAGPTRSDTMAAILERDPDWPALPAAVPPDIVRLLRRCLDKDVARRLRDIGNTRADLDESVVSGVSSPRAATGSRPISQWKVWVPTAAAIVMASVLSAQRFGVFHTAAPSTPPVISRFVETVAGGLQLAPAPSLALTQDGRRLAYLAIQDGTRWLYVRDLNDVNARRLAGTQDADQPFFSHDGAWIAFFAENKLKKVAVAGGAPITIGPVANPRGGTWLPDNTIVFAPSAASVLMRVSAEGGGKAEPASTLDRQLNEGSHRWPRVLPGGDAIVYGAGPTVSSRDWMEAHIVAQSLAGNRRRVVAPHGTFPQFAPTGHLLYAQSGLVYGQAFDPTTFETSGDAFPILERVSGGSVNGGSLIFAVSSGGTIVYVPGFDRQVELVLLDRTGKERIVMPAGSYYLPRLSPDGRLIAVTVVSGTDSDVWIHDINRGTNTKLTSGGRNLWPIWSPDSTRVAYASSREGSTNVYWRLADGSGTEEQLTSTAYTFIPQSWARDGSYLVLTGAHPGQPNRVELMATEGAHTIQPFSTGEGFSTMGSLSADGHWMAYVSDESGRNEVYVRPFPGPGAALQISPSGGDEPVWAGHGLELFFRRGETFSSVNMTVSSGRLTAAAAKPVFTGRYAPGGVRTGYDASPDGRTFLFVKFVQPRENLSQFMLLLNGLEAIRPH